MTKEMPLHAYIFFVAAKGSGELEVARHGLEAVLYSALRCSQYS